MANSFSRISTSGQRESQIDVSGPNSFRPSDSGSHEEVLAENLFHSMLTLGAPESGALSQAVRPDAS